MGFEDALYFSRRFKLRTGLTPKAYRNETVRKDVSFVTELE
ncbi:AraC family transcriptional regulator (plasmid) [Deinococcus sp. KNUC1210]|nr:AraC family transcriptional regulator [Deinococcus sp. KNUC1210]ULH18016.1 AraC family transcriptional regulator [Deinococcus sp. KNUC1210]